jgi:hypothetical protein
MSKLASLSATSAIALGCLGALASPSHAECTAIGAVGTGINEGTAKFMADAALKNIRESRGLKPGGPTTYKCDGAFMLTECRARQNVCK